MVASMNQAPISQGSRVQLWHEVVREAEDRSGRALGEERESYLVFVLQRHLQDAYLLARTQALEWLAAQEQIGSARADALRDVGDRCLLIAGLFPGLAARRRVSVDYYIDLGSGAYDEVARSTRASYADLFAQLARGYRELVLVLRAVRGAAS
jgi:hypothetical protein